MNTDTFCSDSFATNIRAKILGKDVRLKVLSSLPSGVIIDINRKPEKRTMDWFCRWSRISESRMHKKYRLCVSEVNVRAAWPNSLSIYIHRVSSAQSPAFDLWSGLITIGVHGWILCYMRTVQSVNALRMYADIHSQRICRLHCVRQQILLKQFCAFVAIIHVATFRPVESRVAGGWWSQLWLWVWSIMFPAGG